MKPRKDKGQRRTQWVELTCANCGTEFERRLSEVKKQAFCSRTCFQTSSAPSQAGRAGGGRPRTIPLNPGIHPKAPAEIEEAATKYGEPAGWALDRGYVLYSWPEHPDAKAKRITEHRVVAYEHMGVNLNGHHIRHLDSDPSNNRWENLLVTAPEGSIPKPEGVKLWQEFYQWAQQHAPDTLEKYAEAAK